MARRALQRRSSQLAFAWNSRQISRVKPEHGGRLELKLAESGATTARYALTIFTPTGDAETTATLDTTSGAVEIAAWRGSTPPAWLESFARALLRTVVRNKALESEWPRRLTRWRPEPER